MNTFVFSNVPSLKRKNYINQIVDTFKLELMGQKNDVTLLESKDMLVDIDNRWISIIVLKNDCENKTVDKIKEFFY